MFLEFLNQLIGIKSINKILLINALYTINLKILINNKKNNNGI